jgi:nitroimidazol reductase NimA-like FMN-containing flavoprotein (pyridoxamine 5'-phosphate oxidase superfamily)
MTTTKRGSKKKEINRESDPPASRPYMPGYGIPDGKKGMLPWSHVTQRMSESQNYWICTVDPEGRPHSTPVWGLWLDDRLYFGGGPQTRRSRNLANNPSVCVHLESGSDVIILHGDARPLSAPDQSLTTRLIEASAQKYGYKPKPEDYATPGTFVIQPRAVLAWKQFPKDATRWRFPEGE